MTSHRNPARGRTLVAALCLALAGLLILVGCAPATGGGGATSGQPTPAAQATKPPAQAQPTPTAQPAAKPATPAPAAKATTPLAGALDACSLLTKEEVGAVIGKAVDAEKLAIPDPRTVDCEYYEAGRKGNKFAGLAVYALTPSEAKGVHEATKGGGRDQTAVPGLGDDAYWDKTFGMLQILKGRYEVVLSVTRDAAPDPLKAAQELAAKVLSRLP